MNLSAFIAICSLGGLIVFSGYHYTRVHLPQFAEVKAEVLFDKCLRECKEVCLHTCEVNGTREDECVCDCSHCRKYLE